jgi:uncharacterized protein YndB with AHSA1/START domain
MGHYRFQNVWRLTHDARSVYEALADGERYPEWWPQVREAKRLDEDTGEVICQSVLPYRLRMVARRVVSDPVALRLRAALSGDLVGWAEWQITPSGSGSVARFSQQVDTTGFLRRATPLARPIFNWNHEVMMRGGERGLQGLLDRGGFRPAT